MTTITSPARLGSGPRYAGNGMPGLVAMLGGLLWVPYGLFEMLEPWGMHKEYRLDAGYDVVTDTLLYRLYSLPGSLALMLTAVSLLGICRHLSFVPGVAMPVSRALGVIALLVGGITLAGVTVEFDPLFTGPRLLGTLALGAAILLAGWTARGAGRQTELGATLIPVGILGLFLFPLWPMVNGLGIVPDGLGAVIVGIFGLAWFAVGYRYWQGDRRSRRGDHPSAVFSTG